MEGQSEIVGTDPGREPDLVLVRWSCFFLFASVSLVKYEATSLAGSMCIYVLVV